MSTTLYRKYRPQTFAEIVNQEHVKATIQQEITSGKLPHAFLFCGPRGTGKTTTARVIAKALNCSKRGKKESEPCNACASCEAMTGGASLSLVEVDAASQTGVDNVRDNIIANARVAVRSDEYKIFIIDEVHMLSTSSFNALLKILEEPPARVVFILATTELHKIPETIISRCQRFDFHPIKASILQPYLGEIVQKEKREVEESVLQAIVKKSGGYVRDAMSLLGQVLTLPGKVSAESAAFILPVPHKEHVVALVDLISQKQTTKALVYVNDLEQQGLRMVPFSQELIEYTHAVLLSAAGSQPEAAAEGVAGDLRDTVQATVKRLNPALAMRMLDVLMRRHQQLKSFEQGIIPLELAIVELCESSAVAAAPVATPVASVASHAQPQTRAVSTPAPAAKPTPAPAKASAKESSKPSVKSHANAPAPSALAEQATGPSAPYTEVEPVWKSILNDVSEAQHSLFIVLRTALFRPAKDGAPELAFKYRMHHDLAKRSLAVLSEVAKKYLPNTPVRFTVAIDENLDMAMSGDVEEPKSSETAALGAELGRLAEAFGGTVIE